MKMPLEELARRLAEADRARATLRRATVEWRALGERVLDERRRRKAAAPEPREDDGDRRSR